MSKADFIERTVVASAAVGTVWLAGTADNMREKGATFFRASHPPDDVFNIYLEGWRARPTEQGLHPWE